MICGLQAADGVVHRRKAYGQAGPGRFVGAADDVGTDASRHPSRVDNAKAGQGVGRKPKHALAVSLRRWLKSHGGDQMGSHAGVDRIGVSGRDADSRFSQPDASLFAEDSLVAGRALQIDLNLRQNRRRRLVPPEAFANQGVAVVANPDRILRTAP
ncbi:hypothetical protein D3C80_1411940 [compost metagenome]